MFLVGTTRRQARALAGSRQQHKEEEGRPQDHAVKRAPARRTVRCGVHSAAPAPATCAPHQEMPRANDMWRRDAEDWLAPRRAGQRPCASVWVEETGNDPSAGSPTETLLRLLLPLNDKVWTASRGIATSEPVTLPQSGGLTGSFNR